MASPPYAPIEEHIRGILQDVRLTPLERCAAVELYYHTDWHTRRLKCRGVIVAHIRRTLGKTDSTARRTKNRLEDLGFIQGDHFDASAWIRSDETAPPPPKMDPNTSLSSPSSLSLSNSSRPDQRASADEACEVNERDRFEDFKKFLNNY